MFVQIKITVEFNQSTYVCLYILDAFHFLNNVYFKFMEFY